MKRRIIMFTTSVLLTLQSTFPASAGWEWDFGWKYRKEDFALVQNQWMQDLQGRWYYFDASGNMQTNWLLLNERWYYMDSGGEMKVGWIQYDGNWYYLDFSGALLQDTVTPDGYTVNHNGEWIQTIPQKSANIISPVVSGRSSAGGSSQKENSNHGNSNTASNSAILPPPKPPGNATPSNPDLIPKEEQERQKLEYYMNHGLYLESREDKTIEDYVESKILKTDDTVILIGLGFIPVSVNLNRNQYDSVASYQTKISKISLTEGTYYITEYKLSYQHKHEFNAQIQEADCTTHGSRIITCECGYYEETFLPLLGHIEENGDYICDRCEIVLSDCQTGEKQKVTTGLPEPYRELMFTCLDPDYQGGALFLSDVVIPSHISGKFADKSNSYSSSNLRRWLNDILFNNLSVKNNILPVNLPEIQDYSKDHVFALSYDEAVKEEYQEHALNPWEKGQGNSCYWTRTPDEDFSDYEYLVMHTGNPGSDQVGNREAGVKPAYVLKNSDASITEQKLWRLGDIQERIIDGVSYKFRCIDPDYRGTGGQRTGALFLCEQIISGESDILERMNEALEEPEGIRDTDTTVKYSYLGKSTEYDNDLSMQQFTSQQVPYQKTSGKLFHMSLEEAVRYQEILWKLEQAEENNFLFPETGMSGYWLRTAQTGEDKKFYCVSYDGMISPQMITNQKIGIRPAFVALQPSF